MKFLPRKELLTYEEMLRLVRIFSSIGIKKVRITGGEPFVRRDLMNFLTSLSETKGLEEIHITTNGVLTEAFIPQLKSIGISSVNLSVDTFDRDRFLKITKRDELERVQSTYQALLEAEIPLKINAVVMAGQNIEDLIPLAGKSIADPVAVRFIEEMPFNGTGIVPTGLPWHHQRILEELKRGFPEISKVEDPPHSTSANYKIPGAKGSVGIIAAYSRTFCGSCNRIRVTSRGELKKCLYDQGQFSIRDLLRENGDDQYVKETLMKVCSLRPANGFEAEKNRGIDQPLSESMSVIGG